MKTKTLKPFPLLAGAIWRRTFFDRDFGKHSLAVCHNIKWFCWSEFLETFCYESIRLLLFSNWTLVVLSHGTILCWSVALSAWSIIRHNGHCVSTTAWITSQNHTANGQWVSNVLTRGSTIQSRSSNILIWGSSFPTRGSNACRLFRSSVSNHLSLWSALSISANIRCCTCEKVHAAATWLVQWALPGPLVSLRASLAT